MSTSSAVPFEDAHTPLDATSRAVGPDPSERLRWRGPEVVLQPDLAAASEAARGLLEALGLDLRAESLARTPQRMATALAELMTPTPFEMTTFPNDGGYDELIVARAIPARSLCEHHMLPFVGTAHVGYLPGHRILIPGAPHAVLYSAVVPFVAAVRNFMSDRVQDNGDA